MALNYPVKPNDSGYIRVQFYDARTATEATEDGDKYPALIELKYFGDLPEIKVPQIREELKMFKDRGKFQGWDYDEDTMDIPEITFNVDVVDDQVSTNAYEMLDWFEKRKAPDSYGTTDATDLVSTNDGSATVRTQSGGTQDANLPTGLFLCGMHVFFDNGVTGKELGFDFKYVEPREVSLSSADGHGKFSFTVKVWGLYAETTALKEQTTVTT